MTDLYHYLVSDYSATGEGRTVAILITRAFTRTPDETKTTTPEERAKREFKEYFGGWMAHGVEHLSKEDFMKRYASYLPELTRNMINSDDQPFNLNFRQEFHFNFS